MYIGLLPGIAAMWAWLLAQLFMVMTKGRSIIVLVTVNNIPNTFSGTEFSAHMGPNHDQGHIQKLLVVYPHSQSGNHPHI